MDNTRNITDIAVRVTFLHKEKDISSAEVIIEIGDIRRVKPGDIMDACQRAVASAIDVLQKDLDS